MRGGWIRRLCGCPTCREARAVVVYVLAVVATVVFWWLQRARPTLCWRWGARPPESRLMPRAHRPRQRQASTSPTG